VADCTSRRLLAAKSVVAAHAAEQGLMFGGYLRVAGMSQGVVLGSSSGYKQLGVALAARRRANRVRGRQMNIAWLACMLCCLR